MRILIVINSLQTGGAEKLVADSVRLLQEDGVKVELALLNGNNSTFLSQLSDDKTIVIHKLSNGSLYNPLLALKIRRLIANFDLVHVHLFPALYWSAIASWFKGDKPVMVFTEHNTTNNRRNFLFRYLDRMMYGSFDRIIAISEEVKTNLKQHINLPENRFYVISNGIDLEAMKHATAKSVLDTVPGKLNLITMVGSFYPQKDQDTLIRCMTQLGDNFHLALVGDGPRKEKCMALARAGGVSDRIHFLGIRSDVPGLLKGSEVIVLSSNFEGVSLAAIEAMASGKPFIASRVPGLEEMVEGYGLLFSQGDDEELASLIVNLISDRDLYNKISHNCMKRAMDFDIKRNIDSHLKLYKELTDG